MELSIDDATTSFELSHPIRFVDDGIMVVGATNTSRYQDVDVSQVFRGEIRKVKHPCWNFFLRTYFYLDMHTLEAIGIASVSSP